MRPIRAPAAFPSVVVMDTQPRSVRTLVGLGCAASLLVAGCAEDKAPAARDDTASASVSATPSPVAEDVVDGMFDVGGHSLYLHCAGSGSPTVVYLHGSIEDRRTVAHLAGNGFAGLLASDYRTCVYDRRNVGDSDTVDAVQLPADAIEDMHRLLEVAQIEPPYVLVGASFGGMLAYLYANLHADQVVGMVLLDAMFPDELSLEYLFEPEDTYEAYDQVDETEGLERISHFECITAGQEFIGKEPKIPVTYLASDTEGYEDNDYGIAEYDRRVLKVQAAYVHRFSPGKVIRVNAPHFMEPMIPEQIAEEVRGVIQAASGG